MGTSFVAELKWRMARRIKTVLSPSGHTEKGKRLIRLVKTQWKTWPGCAAHLRILWKKQYFRLMGRMGSGILR